MSGLYGITGEERPAITVGSNWRGSPARRRPLIEKVATSIEQRDWEDIDVTHINEVMAVASISTIYAALVDHARQETRQVVIA